MEVTPTEYLLVRMFEENMILAIGTEEPEELTEMELSPLAETMVQYYREGKVKFLLPHVDVIDLNHYRRSKECQLDGIYLE